MPDKCGHSEASEGTTVIGIAKPRSFGYDDVLSRLHCPIGPTVLGRSGHETDKAGASMGGRARGGAGEESRGPIRVFLITATARMFRDNSKKTAINYRKT
jgi:hypothetical protein